MSLLLALQGGGGAITIAADLAATEAQDTAAFSAARVSVAALAASESPDVAAFSATLVHVADLAVTEAPDVLAFSATLIPAVKTITADLAATEAQDVASFAATVVSTARPTPGHWTWAPTEREEREMRLRAQAIREDEELLTMAAALVHAANNREMRYDRRN